MGLVLGLDVIDMLVLASATLNTRSSRSLYCEGFVWSGNERETKHKFQLQVLTSPLLQCWIVPEIPDTYRI